jgi:hypothetical protein
MGLKIWGSPTTPLYGGAFGLSSAADRPSLYEKIPKDVDILVTHGPPYGILDRHTANANHAGCAQLREAVAGPLVNLGSKLAPNVAFLQNRPKT